MKESSIYHSEVSSLYSPEGSPAEAVVPEQLRHDALDQSEMSAELSTNHSSPGAAAPPPAAAAPPPRPSRPPRAGTGTCRHHPSRPRTPACSTVILSSCHHVIICALQSSCLSLYSYCVIPGCLGRIDIDMWWVELLTKCPGTTVAIAREHNTFPK